MHTCHARQQGDHLCASSIANSVGPTRSSSSAAAAAAACACMSGNQYTMMPSVTDLTCKPGLVFHRRIPVATQRTLCMRYLQHNVTIPDLVAGDCCSVLWWPLGLRVQHVEKGWGVSLGSASLPSPGENASPFYRTPLPGINSSGLVPVADGFAVSAPDIEVAELELHDGANTVPVRDTHCAATPRKKYF